MPLPEQFADRWDPVRQQSRISYRDAVCWHLLLGSDAGLRAVVGDAQERLSRFGGFHPVPVQWLHITLLRAGAAEDITADRRAMMLGKARAALAGITPPAMTVERVIYHPEAVVLKASPAAALVPLRAAVAAVTAEATGTNPETEDTGWFPHLTVGYSTGKQAAAPVIAGLGKSVPSCTVTVRRVSLVVQNGAEDAWNWHVVGSVDL